MDHQRTPLFTALIEPANRNPIPFHIPGHNRGGRDGPITS